MGIRWNHLSSSQTCIKNWKNEGKNNSEPSAVIGFSKRRVKTDVRNMKVGSIIEQGWGFHFHHLLLLRSAATICIWPNLAVSIIQWPVDDSLPNQGQVPPELDTIYERLDMYYSNLYSARQVFLTKQDCHVFTKTAVPPIEQVIENFVTTWKYLKSEIAVRKIWNFDTT